MQRQARVSGRDEMRRQKARRTVGERRLARTQEARKGRILARANQPVLIVVVDAVVAVVVINFGIMKK